MQQPVFFDNQIVKKSNFDFLNDSTAKNIKDVVSSITSGRPGAITGLDIDPSSTSLIKINPGYGYTYDGERVQLYLQSGTYPIFNGYTHIFAGADFVNFDPDPSSSTYMQTVSGISAQSYTTNPVRQYNIAALSIVSGASTSMPTTSYSGTLIYLGNVHTTNGVIDSIDVSMRDKFSIGMVNVLDYNIDGAYIGAGTIDSTSFKTPLSADITLDNGVNILATAPGVNNLGNATNVFSNVFAETGTFHQINGMSPIVIDSLIMNTGKTIESYNSSESLKLDTSNRGTVLGNNLIVKSNSIDASSNTNGLQIIADPTSSVIIDANKTTINADVDINGSNGLTVANAIQSNSLVVDSIITNDITVNGSFGLGGGINQNFENLIQNSDFSQSIKYSGQGNVPSSGIPAYPDGWSIETIKTIDNPLYATGFSGSEYGAGSAIKIPSPLVQYLNSISSYTIEMDYYYTDINGSTGPYSNSLVSLSSDDDTTASSWSLVHNNSKLRLENGSTFFEESNTRPLSQWMSVAIVKSGNSNVNGLIYVDKVLVASGTNVLLQSQFAGSRFRDMVFGVKEMSSSNYSKTLSCRLNGGIKNIRISNIVRPSGAMHSGLATQPLTIDANTLAYYPLDNSFEDVTSNKYHLSNVADDIKFCYQGTGTRILTYYQNSYNDPTLSTIGATHGLKVIASGIDSNGFTLSSDIVDSMPGATYNVSFYDKLNQGTSLNYNVFISGNGVMTTPATFTTSSSNVWDRKSASITTTSSMINQKVYIQPLTTVASPNNFDFSISNVQVSKGSSIFGYKKNRPTVLVNRVNNGTSTLLYPNRERNKYLDFSFEKIYTSGGFVRVKCKMPIGGTSASSNRVQMQSELQIDNSVVDVSSFLTYSAYNARVQTEMTLEWEGYLTRGFHDFSVFYSAYRVTNNGGTDLQFSTNNQLNIYILPSSFSVIEY
jgi:hypothetical protein